MADEDKKVEKTEEPKAEDKKPEAKAEDKAPEAKKEEPKAEDKKPEAKADKAEAKSAEKPAADKAKANTDARGGDRKGPRGKGGKKGGGPNRSRSRGDKEQNSEFTEKVVQVRRVTKVCKGGKKLSFRAVVVIGNEKGKVGVGVGKASEVINAIKKAVSDARKKLTDVKMVGSTIAHNIIGKEGGAKILLRPAAEGTGIIAGGAARTVLELSGLGDVLAKSQGSNCPLNVARATIKALKSTRTFKEVAAIRGISVKDMLFN